MRIAFVSDIHANLQAWNAVLLDIGSNGVDHIVCLGDIIGYGPQPAETLQSVHAHVHHFVLGNHDAVICGKMDTGLFNEKARELINWTRSRLADNAVTFLAGIPLTLKGDGFRCSHGDFSAPGAFHYVIEPQDALASWNQVAENLLLVGHTHVPKIFVLGGSGIPRQVTPQDFALEPGKRFLVNVGSVGNPRDGDTRASYVIFDTEQQALFWRRIPFDIDAYRAAMQQAGLPLDSSHFLRDDPRQSLPALRTMLNFSPPEEDTGHVRDTVEVEDMAVLRRKAAHWKSLALALILALTGGGGAGGLLWWHNTPRPQSLGNLPAPLSPAFAGDSISAVELPAFGLPPHDPVPGWRLHYGDRRHQTVSIETDEQDDTPVLRAASQAPRATLRLSSPVLLTGQYSRLYIQIMTQTQDDFEGNIEMLLSLTRENAEGDREHSEHYFIKEPNERRTGGWLLARNTFQNLPAGTHSVQLHIRGNFKGTVLIKDPQLTLRQ